MKEAANRGGLTSAAVVRPLASLLPDRFSAGQGARNPSTGMCGVPCRQEAALGSKRPRSRGKSVVQPGPWNNFAAVPKFRQFQK
jgi:hypothetical protein